MSPRPLGSISLLYFLSACAPCVCGSLGSPSIYLVAATSAVSRVLSVPVCHWYTCVRPGSSPYYTHALRGRAGRPFHLFSPIFFDHMFHSKLWFTCYLIIKMQTRNILTCCVSRKSWHFCFNTSMQAGSSGRVRLGNKRSIGNTLVGFTPGSFRIRCGATQVKTLACPHSSP